MRIREWRVGIPTATTLIRLFFVGVGLLPFFVEKVMSADDKTCHGQELIDMNIKNGFWYPSNCTSKQVPIRTRCHFVCSHPYIFEPGRTMESDCVIAKYGHGWVRRNTPNCIDSRKCPPLDYEEDSYAYNHQECTSKPVRLYQSCYGQCRKGSPIPVGKGRDKLCLKTGNWSIVGGFFCRPDFQISLSLPSSSIIVGTDPGKRTANVTGKLPQPITNVDLRNVAIKEEKGGDLQNLPVGSYTILYTVEGRPGSSPSPKQVKLPLQVKDTEAPRLVECPEEVEYVIPRRESVKMSYGNILFTDNVDGNITKSDSRISDIIYSLDKTVGSYKMIYGVSDKAGNQAFCHITFTVRGRPCKANPLKHADVDVTGIHLNTYMYKAKCRDNATQSCYNSFNCGFSNIPRWCRGFKLSGPVDDCAINNTYPVNGSCLPGFLLYKGRCAPCPLSYFFNATSKSCQLCPENMTTSELGSLTCQPCPFGSMTKSQFLPRSCEYLCSDGWKLFPTNETCSKCPRGTYAARGATKCEQCPIGMTTLFDASTSLHDCVCGKIVNTDEKVFTVDNKDVPYASISACRYKVEPPSFPSKLMLQRLAISVRSSHLKGLSNCSEGYFKVSAIMTGLEYDLTEKLCGSVIDKPIVVTFRPWRSHIIEYYFRDKSLAKLDVRLGIASCSFGQFFNITTLKCSNCPLDTFQNATGAVECLPCPHGTTSLQEGALNCIDECPAGYFRDGMYCSPCKIGFYQDKVEQSTCNRCPTNTSTAGDGAKNVSDCTSACGPGQYKHGNSCLPCPSGMFQDRPSHASPSCVFCPSGKTTLGKGKDHCVGNAEIEWQCSQGKEDTKLKLNCVHIEGRNRRENINYECAFEGEYYNTSLKRCQKCPIGTYKLASNNQTTNCTSCPADFSTDSPGAVSKVQCKDMIDNCKSKPCHFPGVCVDTGNDFKCLCPELYTGQRCEIKLHPCEGNPCRNNGTCHNNYGILYHCECLPGWTGLNCETEYRACDRKPCLGRGNCTNIGNDFKCACEPYFTGRSCQTTMRRPCHSQPCRNKGTCIDGPYPGAIPRYTCECRFDYTGQNCESEIDNCINNTCNATGTLSCSDHVHRYYCRCNQGYKGVKCNERYGCLPGHYSDRAHSRCTLCPKGQFQSLGGYQYSCYDCLEGFTTLREGSTHPNDCKDLRSSTKLESTFRMSSAQWKNSLADKSSSEFKSLAKKVENNVKKLYANESNFKDAIVNEFRQGSVICDIVLYFEKAVQNPEKILEESVKQGQIGDIAVDKSFLKNVVDKGDKDGKPEKKSNTVTIVVVTVVIILLLFAGGATYFFLVRKGKVPRRTRKTTDYSSPDQSELRVRYYKNLDE